MQLPMSGTTDKTETSRFQVTLVDNTDKRLHPTDYPRTNRFFDTVDDRNAFVTLFESTIIKSGGRLVKHRINHPLFTSFDILDQHGKPNMEITIYH